MGIKKVERRRVTFSAWGIYPAKLRERWPTYAVAVADESGMEAALRAIQRATRLSVVVCRPDATALDDHGRPEARHYEVTLGRAVARRFGGGYSVEGRAWLAIPIPARAGATR